MKNVIKFPFYEQFYDLKYWKVSAIILETLCNLNVER